MAKHENESKQAQYDRGVVPGTPPEDIQASDASREEADLFKSCWDRFQDAQIGGNQAHERYEEYLERWRMARRLAGRQDWQADIRTGVGFAVIETEVALILSSLPKAEFSSGESPLLQLMARMRGALCKDWEDRSNAVGLYETWLRKSLINSVGWLKVYWDPFKNGGMGDAAMRILDGRNVYVAADESSFEGFPELFVIEWFYPEQLEGYFGERAAGLSSAGAAVSYGSGLPSDSSTSTPRMIPIIYRYWMCYEFKEQEIPVQQPSDGGGPVPESEMDDLGDDEVDGKKTGKGKNLRGVRIPVMKYPSGRITIFHESGRILDDRPNSYPFWNIVPLVNYKDPERAMGVSEFDLIAQTEDSVDRFVADVCEHESAFAGPGLKLPTNCGIEPDQVTLRPREIYPTNPGTSDEVQYLNPPPVHDYIVRFPEFLLQMMQRATGVSEIAQGIRPAGLETFASIQSFKESTLGRLKPKSKATDRAYTRVLELLDYILTTHYVTPRKLAIAGDEGKKLMEAMQDPQQMQAAQENSGFGQPGAELPWGKDEVMKYLGQAGENYYFSLIAVGLRGTCKIKAERGNIVEMTQSDVAAMGRDLFQLQAIDQQALLDVTQFPNREQVLERSGQLQQAQQQIQQLTQQIQQMQKQAQAGPVAPGPGAAVSGQPAPQPGQLEDHGPLDPNIENALLAEGRNLPVHPEDGPDHIPQHTKALQQTPKEKRPAFEAHIQLHQQQGQPQGGQPS